MAHARAHAIIATALFVTAVSMIGCTSLPPAEPAERVPIKPIRYAGWKHAFRLQNHHMEVVIVPGVGRIMGMAFKGRQNLLREAQDPSELPTGTTFINYGGDWLWPLAQSRWENISEANWPPPAAIGEAAWQAEAWTNKDGSQSCLMMRGYGDPVHAWVSRVITLDARIPQLRIRQRLLQTGPCEEALTLWNITQITRPKRVFLPAQDTDQPGFIPMLFGAPPESHWQQCGNVIVYNALEEGQFKLGSPGTNTWIAAQSEHALIIERTFNDRDGPFPDGGCPVEMFASSDAGYVEIETLSPEIALPTGSSLENTLVIECHLFDASMDDCDATAKVVDLLKGIRHSSQAQAATSF